MSVIKDFKCIDCGPFEDYVDRDCSYALCPRCAKNCERVFLKAPALTGEIRTTFYAHYDEMLGQHFGSAEEKKAFLKKTNRDQISGHLSPQKDTKSQFKCTKKQAEKTFGIAPAKRLSGSTNEPL